MIVIEDVIKTFDGRCILDKVGLQIKKGETVVIIGGSGCGKSTLLKLLIGSLKPDSGRILIKGKDIARMSEPELEEVRKTFGMLFQGAALFNSMTVGENVALPLREHTKLGEKYTEPLKEWTF